MASILEQALRAKKSKSCTDTEFFTHAKKKDGIRNLYFGPIKDNYNNSHGHAVIGADNNVKFIRESDGRIVADDLYGSRPSDHYLKLMEEEEKSQCRNIVYREFMDKLKEKRKEKVRLETIFTRPKWNIEEQWNWLNGLTKENSEVKSNTINFNESINTSLSFERSNPSLIPIMPRGGQEAEIAYWESTIIHPSSINKYEGYDVENQIIKKRMEKAMSRLSTGVDNSSLCSGCHYLK